MPSSVKSQAHAVGAPELVSVKPTASGAVPLVGLAVKLAVGADGPPPPPSASKWCQ